MYVFTIESRADILDRNISRFDIDYTGPGNTTTHVMTWRPDGIYFKSYYGDFMLAPPPGNAARWQDDSCDILALVQYWLEY